MSGRVCVLPRGVVSGFCEEGEHGPVDVDAKGAGGEDVGSDVEFSGGDEERGVDVGLGDEVAELGGDYGGGWGCVFGFGFGFGFGGAFEFEEYVFELGECAEETDALAAVAHSWF